MIAHHSIYARVYKKVYVYAMIIFCWVFSYGFQLPTLFEVWGKENEFFIVEMGVDERSCQNGNLIGLFLNFVT